MSDNFLEVHVFEPQVYAIGRGSFLGDLLISGLVVIILLILVIFGFIFERIRAADTDDNILLAEDLRRLHVFFDDNFSEIISVP